MATTRTNEPSQGDGGVPPPAPGPGPPSHQASSRGGNKVFKSGPLFLSCKGIGWTSWKKRWFILTRTSLVFFRTDPSAIPQKGSEVNLTLGGIDLNNSGSVVVKADKKLLTVAFADGRDGRAFTLKAETMEDLYEWKTALENALAEAPPATFVMGQNGIFNTDQANSADGSTEQLKDKQSMKPSVVGRPVLLALEEVDGSPSFLEKALRFLEEYGVKVEGILRQAADVDDVEHRLREYDQGKGEFSPDEDPHVIADCIKYILREMPSPPIPASCCNALLEACRVDRERRVNAMRTAICETFPEPNRRLMQRILIMMQAVASHKAENRMSSSAVAACMAPLLLRPLLAGDCQLENDFDVGGDGSMQLLQAAAAANHAQAIVITLLEEYDKIFEEGSLSPDLYSEAEESGTESEDETDYDESCEEDETDDGSQDSEVYTDDETDNVSNASGSRSYDDGGSTHSGETDGDGSTSGSHYSSEEVDHFDENEKIFPSAHQKSLWNVQSLKNDNLASHQGSDSPKEQKNNGSTETLIDNIPEKSHVEKSAARTAASSMCKSTTIASGQIPSGRRPAVWGRTPGKKNLSMEVIDISFDDEAEIQRLENAKVDLEHRIAEEVQENTILRANIENEKIALLDRRQALEQEVARLQEQLQNEKDIRRALEAALKEPREPVPCPVNLDEKTKADLEELAKTKTEISNLELKVDDLGEQINRQREENRASSHDPGNLQQSGMSKDNETKSSYTRCPAERSQISKGSDMDGTLTEEEKRMESTSADKHQPSTQQQQQLDSPGSGKSRHNEQSAKPTVSDPGTGKISSSRKFGARAEERRKQITNELRSSMNNTSGPDKTKSPEKATSSGTFNSEDNRGSDDAPSNPEKSNDLDPTEDLSRGWKSDGQNPSESAEKDPGPSNRSS